MNSSRLIVRVGFLARFSAADSLACRLPGTSPVISQVSRARFTSTQDEMKKTREKWNETYRDRRKLDFPDPLMSGMQK